MFKATHKHDSFVRTLAAWPCSSFYQRMIQLQQLYTCHPSARHSQAVINDTCTNKVIGPTGDYMWWVYDECASHRIVCGEAVQWKGGGKQLFAITTQTGEDSSATRSRSCCSQLNQQIRRGREKQKHTNTALWPNFQWKTNNEEP